MRLTCIILLSACLGAAATGGAQITLQERNAPLQKIFKSIKRQSGYNILCRASLLEQAGTVTVSLTNVSIERAMNAVLQGKGLEYSIEEKNVIIREKVSISVAAKESQPIEVRGKVIDSAGVPLQGVSITIRGKSDAGVSTSADGSFSLTAEIGQVILFTSVGFEDRSLGIISVDQASNLVVTMVHKISGMDEITIGTSYTTTTKRQSTSSIVKITAKEIERQPVTSPLLALQGRVPGLDITPQAGGPGNAPKIRIRGNNSLRSNGSLPLYIIDGIAIESAPINNNNALVFYGGADPLSSLNPENIESIEVLKDADATAIYGSRGANGVIVIRTRQAKPDGVTNFSFNSYVGAGRVVNHVKLLNTQQYLAMRREAFANDGATPDMSNGYDLLLWDTTRYTDWQKELLGGTSIISDVQGVVTGGNQYTSFRLGAGYHKETLVFPGDFNYQRGNGSLNVNHSSADKKLKVSINTNYGYQRDKLFSDLNIINQAITLPPNAPPLYNENGDLNWAPKPDGFNSFQNPLAKLLQRTNSTTKSFISNAVLTYTLMQGLTAKMNMGYTDLQSDETAIVPIGASAPEFRNTNLGRATFSNTKRNSWVIEPQLSYDQQLADHSLAAIIGATLQHSNNNYRAIFAEGYTSDALLGSIQGAQSYTLFETIGRYKYASLFTRAQYGYKKRYLLSATVRRDGSSRFGPDNRFGTFYSVASAWIFSDEAFLNKSRFLSFGKLRASYGVTGNDQIGDYEYYNTFRFGTLYQNTASLVSNGLFNPDFAWEVTKKMEAAVELGFIDDRIRLEVNWYRNISSNQLVNYQLPATTGFPGVFSNFDAATIRNTGIESIISVSVLKRTRLKWDASFNISFSKNKLVEFDGIENSAYSKTYKVGEPLSIQRLYKWIGIDPLTGRHRFADLNSNGIADDADKVFINPTDKSYYGGLFSSLQYKNFDFSVLFQFSKQEGRRMVQGMPGRYFNQPVEVLASWKKILDISNNPRLSQRLTGPPDNNPQIDASNASASDYNFVDASFIRLKTLSLSYQLPDKMAKAIFAREFKLFLQGQNLFTFTNYVNLDPETGSALPPLRMLTIGVSAKF